jgi:hypothetical protein
MKIPWKQLIKNLEQINGRAILDQTFALFTYYGEKESIIHDGNNELYFEEESNQEIEISNSMGLIDTNGERQLYDFVKIIPHDISEIIK